MRAFLSQVELVYVTTLEDKALTLFQGTSQTSKSQKNPYTILPNSNPNNGTYASKENSWPTPS